MAAPIAGLRGTDIALPRAFSAGYGRGVRRGLSLGGGGLFFVAWQVAYLHQLAADGILVAGADRIVGTSAGSITATALAAGRLNRLHREVSLLAKVPALVGALAPASKLGASQERALDLFRLAGDAEPATIRAIGHAALAAATPGPAAMRRNIALLLGVRSWPGAALHVSCVDAYSGERCIVTQQARAPITAAVAASSAVPGLFATQLIADRRCMDGGVSGTGLHLDVLGGADRVLALALSNGSDVVEGLMTTAPGSIQAEIGALGATGTQVEVRVPESVDTDELMSPAAVPKALAMGRRQARADRAALTAFWS